MKYICVFCGTSDNGAIKYAELAKRLGKAIVANGYGLVFGAGNTGLMKLVADSVLEAKGEVIGVITEEIRKLDVTHIGIQSQNLLVETLYTERKIKMINLSAGFIALPGGLGTFDEIAEISVINQFASYKNTPENPVKPVVILNADGFYDGLLMQYNRAHADKFMAKNHTNMTLFTEDPVTAVEHIASFKEFTPDDSPWWQKELEVAR